MRVSDTEIALFASCPRKFGYSRLSLPLLPEISDFELARAVMLKSYFRAAAGEKVPWKRVCGWLERACLRRLIKVGEDQGPEKIADGISDSLLIRKSLSPWYFRYFQNTIKEHDVYPLLQLEAEIGDSHVCTSSVDAVYVSRKTSSLTLAQITMTPPLASKAVLLKDLKLRTQIYLLFRSVKTLPSEVDLIFVPTGSGGEAYVKCIEITPRHDAQALTSNTHKCLTHILEGMRQGVDYPVPGLQCSPCAYEPICVF